MSKEKLHSFATEHCKLFQMKQESGTFDTTDVPADPAVLPKEEL